VVLVSGVVHVDKGVVGGERLEVMLKLVRERLPQLLLPVEFGVLSRQAEERAVVEHDDGARRVRAAELRGVALRDALAERVDAIERGVRLRSALDPEPIDAGSILLGDPLPLLPGALLELVERHITESRRSGSPPRP